MRNWVIYSLILISGSFPFFAFATDATSASCYLAVSFGNGNANGTYQYYGDYNSQPEFINENAFYLGYTFSAGDSFWKIAPTTSGEPNYYYNHLTGVDYDPTHGTWNKNTSGTEPAGTLSLITCPGVESLATSTATSTPNQTQQNLFNGVLLFFLSTGFVVWLFRK